VAALNVPEAYVQEWLAANVQFSSTLHSLARLEFRERMKVIKRAMELNEVGHVRVGVDHFLQGCVRKRMPESSSYGPSPAVKISRGAPMSAEARTTPGSSGGSSGVLVSLDGNASGWRECSGSAAPPAPLSPTMPVTVPYDSAARARPPSWVAELMRGEVDRCRIVRAVSERCSVEVRTRLCAIDPFMQFAVCAGVIMDATKCVCPSEAVADFCARYDIMQAVIAEPAAAALPAVPRCVRLAVFAVGVGMGAAAPALLAAVGKVKLSEPATPVPVEVVEVNAVGTNSIGDGYDVAVIPRVAFPVLMYPRANDHLDMVRRRGEYWQSHPGVIVNAALLVGVDSDPGFNPDAMLEAADLLREAGVLVETVVYRRSDGCTGSDWNERFGSGVWTDAARFWSPARPWMIYRSCLSPDTSWGPAPRDLAIPLSAASQSRARVQPAAAPQYRAGEYLPSYETYRDIVSKMLYREMLTVREQNYARLLWGGFPVEGRRLLTREALMKIHGFEQWPQASVANEVSKCEGIINPVSGVSAPAGAPGSVACGVQRYCIPCESFYGACDSSVHAGVFVSGLVLPLVRLTYRMCDAGTCKEPRL
jgi:hypothetical protein